MFDTFRQDLKFTARQLVSRPAFTIASLITLTLGIGAVSTMVTLVQGVLLHQLPFHEAERIVNLWEQMESGSEARVSKPNFADWSEQSTSFEHIAFYSGWLGDEPVVTSNGATNLQTVQVSTDFFDVLAVKPLVGRLFSTEETQLGAASTVVISEAVWRDKLGAPARLGNTQVRLQGESAQVIGVVPNELVYPPDTGVWHPAERQADTSARTAHNWAVIARLGSGVSRESAQSEINAIAARIKTTYGDDASSSAVAMRSIKDEMVGDSRRPLFFLFGASALVLLLAATNLATGLLARAVERTGEMTLRSALGAGAKRLLRQLLTESIVLTTLGGLVGTAFAFGAVQLLKDINSEIPRLDTVRVDGGVLLTTLAISAAVGLIFGLIPALRATRVNLSGTVGRAAHASNQRLWTTMVASEVALALVLLVGSLMLLSELWTLLSRDTGFDITEVATIDVAVPDIAFPEEFEPEAYAELERRVAQFHHEFAGDLIALPGVASTAHTRELPLRGTNTNGRLCLVPRDCSADKDLQAYAGYRLVSSSYFNLLQIPVLEGRAFTELDTPDTEFVAIINRTFADRYFPNGDAIGQQVLSGGMDMHFERATRIVGVVGNIVHRSLDATPVSEIYYPAAQRALRTAYASHLVRAEPGALPATLESLRNYIVTEHPYLPPDVLTLESIRVESLNDRRFALLVLSALALVALGLALTGIWAVVTYRVAQRRQEIGVRVALGLSRRGVMGLVFSDTAKLLAIGVVAGSALAFGLTRALRSQIGGLDGHPSLFALAAVLLVAAGLVAAWLPARRATRIEPSIAMRS